ncbi:hypothetical protein [Desulfosporosinus sp. BG]|nr:hypothetical protein [Desulfosporosinus sp. BG]ODA42552.1 hypothetical protein DSBG_0692 [Desulfosporosinus sp. BG]
MSTALAINSFVANLSFFFTEKPLMERFATAKAMELNEVHNDDIS